MTQTKTYPNGMRLVVETDPNALSSECLFSFDVGALNEKEYEAGYAHMLEHMLAGESSNKHKIKEINQIFASAGTELDAVTSLKQTNYSFYSLNESFEKCFAIFCESLFDCAFDENEFEKEKKVILQEHGDTDSYPDLNDLSWNIFFDGQVPIAIDGDQESIANANLKMLQEFYKREYTPNNLIISIHGNKNLEEIEELLDKYLFCYIDKNNQISSPKRNLLTTPSEKIFEVFEDRNIQVKTIIIFPLTKRDDYVARNLFINALNGYDGLLYEKLRIEEGLVYGVDSFYESETGNICIMFESAKEDVSKCLTKIRGVIDEVAKNGISPTSLTSAIAKTQLSLIMSKDDSSFKTEANAESLYENKIYSLEEELEKYKKADNEHIKLIAQNLLNSNYMVAAQGKGLKREQLYAFDPLTYRSKFDKFKTFKHLKHLKKAFATEEYKRELPSEMSKNDEKPIEK